MHTSTENDDNGSYLLSVMSWFLGKLESIQVKTTVEELKTIAWRPSGGTRGVADSREAESDVLLVS